MTRRNHVPPPPRAVSVFARTVYRQFQRTGFDRSAVLAFVNELLELVTSKDAEGPLAGFADAEIPIVNAETLRDTLASEMRRTRDIGIPLSLVLVDCTPPDWSTDSAAFALHKRVADRLRQAVRAIDTVGRLSTCRYAVVLVGVSREGLAGVIARLERSIMRAGDDESMPAGTRVETRAIVHDGSLETPEALIARCAASAPGEIAEAPRSERTLASRPADRGVVLALGGGAARAAAHIGVLRALDRHGVPITSIAGTSAGALVGAMYLAGIPPADMLERFLAFTGSSTYAQMRRAYILYRRAARARGDRRPAHDNRALMSSATLSAIDGDLAEEFIAYFLGPDRDVSELSRPLSIAVTDLVSGRPVWIAHGSLRRALRASCAVPGLFAPLFDGERVLVDGATLAEVPVAAARALDARSRLVAVHLERESTPIEPGEIRTGADVVLRASAMTHRELVREQLKTASELLAVEVGSVGWLDFRRAEETAALGEEAAEAWIESG
jgi:NTE family protein